MNILFLHKNFPAQFKYLCLVLAQSPNNKVVFITEETALQVPNITKVNYTVNKTVTKNAHPYTSRFESHILEGQAVAAAAMRLKRQGFEPDVIYGHSGWGATMFMKDVFPNTPLISFCEWYGYADGPETAFDGRVVTYDAREEIRCSNADLLIDLVACDFAVCPTQWQKEQFPKEFHHKIQVLHDGIDVETCHPDANATFLIKDKNLELSAKDEILTYGTRGMELYRGFPQFMEAAEKLLKKRPNLHVVIAGDDITCYGPKLEGTTYKTQMLKKLDLDMNRVHFIGTLNFYDYVKFLQISTAHVYATYPYVLSWSMLNAMAAGCCLIASNTQPVVEMVQDNFNGLLYEFFNVDQLIEKVEYALDNREKVQVIRDNARKTIEEKYDLRKLLVQQLSMLTVLAQQKNKG